MASFNDYVEKGDLSSEIDDAAHNQRARDEKGRFIPERFKGKDIEDVVQSYEELEKLNSRQAQDLGAMRAQVDQLMQITQSNGPSAAQAQPLTVDDLYENPDDSVRRVAKEALSEEVTELRNTVQEMRQKTALDSLTAKYPNWQTDSQSSEFSEWVNETPYRQTMGNAVRVNGDLDAAQELLGMYYDHQQKAQAVQTEVQAQTRVQQQLRDATLETGSPEPTTIDDTFSRYDLLEARLAAKRGDSKAERWLSMNAEAIALAYEEGRIVD